MGDIADTGSATFGQPLQQPEQTPASENSLTERAQRRRVIKGVRISFQNDYCAVEGVMKNVSDTGALIELKDGYLIPDTITIYDELAGFKVNATVVRRSANRIGVRFFGERTPIEQKRAQVVMEIGMPGSEVDIEESEEELPDSGAADSLRNQPSIRRKPVFGKLKAR